MSDGQTIHGIDTSIADPAERINAFMSLWQSDAHVGFDTDLVRNHLSLTSISPSGTAVFALTIPPAYSNRMGNLHGGAAALIFDVCTTSAIAPIAKPGFWSFAGVTRNLNITYLRPAPVGEKCTVVCEVVHAGRRLVTVRGEIRNQEGKICCISEHLKANIDPPPGGRGPVRGGKL